MNVNTSSYDRDGLIARLAAAVLAVDHARAIPTVRSGVAGIEPNPAYGEAWQIADKALAIANEWLAEYASHEAPAAPACSRCGNPRVRSGDREYCSTCQHVCRIVGIRDYEAFDAPRGWGSVQA